MTDWYYTHKGRVVGPVEESTLHHMLRRGKLKPHSYVWRAGFEDWQTVQETSLGEALRHASAGRSSEEEALGLTNLTLPQLLLVAVGSGLLAALSLAMYASSDFSGWSSLSIVLAVLTLRCLFIVGQRLFREKD